MALPEGWHGSMSEISNDTAAKIMRALAARELRVRVVTSGFTDDMMPLADQLGAQHAKEADQRQGPTDAQLITAARKLANYELTDEDVAFYLPRWRAFATEIGARSPAVATSEGDAR